MEYTVFIHNELSGITSNIEAEQIRFCIKVPIFYIDKLVCQLPYK